MNGAEVVAEILKREGTEFLSCYPRNTIIEPCAALGIRPILCRQERVGVGLADGYSRIKRGKKNGVFGAQAGPGIENAFPGIAQAYAENVPILIVSGGLALARQHVRPVFRAADVYRPVTKWTALAHSAQELPDLMRRAYQAMRSGKGGPVLIEIPDEVAEAEFKGTLDYVPVPVMRAAPDPDAVRKAVQMLLAAKNPILWAGQGVHYAEAGDRMAALAELVPAAVVTTNPGQKRDPREPSAVARRLDALALENVRRLHGQGRRRAGGRIEPHAYAVRAERAGGQDHHPFDQRRRRHQQGVPRRSCHRRRCRAGARCADRGSRQAEGPKRRNARRQRAQFAQGGNRVAKKAWLDEWGKFLNSDETPLNQYRVIRDLMRTVDRDNVIMTHDSGSPREQMMPFWETTAAGSYMGWGKSTQLGYGLGITMGAKLAAPKKLCVNVMGDAAIGMTGMDIETAARNRIGILTVVFNNGVMGAERDVLKISDEKYGAMTVGGNYTKVAEGLNVAARRVEKPADIVSGIKEAVGVTESGAPFLLEFVVKEGRDFSRYQLAGL